MSIRKTLAVVVGVAAVMLALMAGPARAQDGPYSTSSCEVQPGQQLPEGCNSSVSDTQSSSVLGEQETRVLGVQVSRDLAVTGSDILTLVAVAGVAILAGFGFRTLSRRRTS